MTASDPVPAATWVAAALSAQRTDVLAVCRDLDREADQMDQTTACVQRAAVDRVREALGVTDGC